MFSEVAGSIRNEPGFGDGHISELLHQLLAQLVTALSVRRAHIATAVSDDFVRLAAAWQDGAPAPAEAYPLSNTPCAMALASNSHTVVNSDDDLFPHLRMLGVEPTHGYASHPILDSTGSVLGYICLFSNRPIRDTADMRTALSLVAGRIAAEVEHDNHDRDTSTQIRDIQALLANLPGMVYRRSSEPGSQMLYVSRGCFALSGYRPEDLIEGRPCWSEIMHPDDRDAALESVQNALQRNEEFEIQYRITAGDKQYKWVLDRGRAVSTDDGASLLEGFVSDITPLRMKEIELAHEHERMHATIEYAPIGIMTFDRDLKIVAANSAFADMIGFAADEIVGRQFSDFTHPDEVGKTTEAALSSFSENRNHFSIRTRYTHKDGHIVHAALHVAVGYDAKGRPEFGVANVEDLTARMSALALIEDQRNELARMDRLSTLGEMTAGIAHELNQPLTAISTYAQAAVRFASQGNTGSDRVSEALTKMSEQSLRASAIVERIRTLARQARIQAQPVDCSELVRKTIDLIDDAGSSGIEFRMQLARDLPTVLCDPSQVQQVLLNLLRNAAESMRRAEFSNGKVIVLTTEAIGDRSVRISVVDSGQGVDDSIGGTLFEPFSTSASTGLGMGLSTARSILHSLGGEIEYRNNPSGGATFTITLPGHTGEYGDEQSPDGDNS